MAVMVKLKHVLRDSNGAFRYKRRVPKTLQNRLGGRSYFIMVLGRSEAEVVVRNAGRTLREIADELNRAGVPTARGSSWQASQVMRVLERLDS